MKSGPKPRDLPERFLESYIPEPNSGCWLWVKGVNEHGYGRITLPSGEQKKAHRVSWILHRGYDPGPFLVCHKCDNPACVNPEHLFIGTQADNLSDCAVKGRISRVHQPRGEKQGSSKLTAEIVIALRASDLSVRKASRAFGVSPSTVHDVRSRKNWRHI